jgi:hypothetical protein
MELAWSEARHMFSRLWLSGSMGPDSFLKMTSGAICPEIIVNRRPPCPQPHCQFVQGLNTDRIVMRWNHEVGEDSAGDLLAEVIIPND